MGDSNASSLARLERELEERYDAKVAPLEMSVERHEAKLGELQRRRALDDATLRNLQLEAANAATERQRKEVSLEKKAVRDLELASTQQVQQLREQVDLKLTTWHSELARESARELRARSEQASTRLEQDV